MCFLLRLHKTIFALAHTAREMRLWWHCAVWLKRCFASTQGADPPSVKIFRQILCTSHYCIYCLLFVAITIKNNSTNLYGRISHHIWQLITIFSILNEQFWKNSSGIEWCMSDFMSAYNLEFIVLDFVFLWYARDFRLLVQTNSFRLLASSIT